MSAADREQIRLCILRYCMRPTSTGLILSNLRAEGFRGATRETVDQETRYLSDKAKGLLATQDKKISPENKVWETTAAGRDFLAEQGQEDS